MPLVSFTSVQIIFQSYDYSALSMMIVSFFFSTDHLPVSRLQCPFHERVGSGLHALSSRILFPRHPSSTCLYERCRTGELLIFFCHLTSYIFLYKDHQYYNYCRHLHLNLCIPKHFSFSFPVTHGAYSLPHRNSIQLFSGWSPRKW